MIKYLNENNPLKGKGEREWKKVFSVQWTS